MEKIFTFLLAGLLIFVAASGTASAFNLAGNTYNITKGNLSNTNVIVEEYSFGQMGPALIGSYTNTSNATGYFNVQSIPDTPSSNFKIILRHFNATTGNLDYIGQSLPMFPYFETAQLAMGLPVDFYLKQGGTINLTATNGTYPQNFSYMVKDTRLGYPIVENFTTEVSNVTIYLPADRNYSIMIYPNRSFPVSFDLSNSLLNSTYNYVANVSFNTSNTLRKVSGYANLSNGSANFSDLKIIAYLMEPGNMIFQDYPLPYNMSQWCQYGPSPCAGDVYNATTGYYNITLPGAAMTANILLFATANTTGEYYGIFRNVSLNYSEEPVTNFNFTLQPLLGSEENISITNAGGGGGGPSRINVTTKKLSFLLRNSSDANINNAHVEVEVDYSAYNGSAFNWMADVSATSNGQFSIPAINANINKINIYTQGSAPLKTSKTAAQLATSPVRINLSSFNPGAINVSEGPPPIFIDMLKSTSLCDVPYPQAGCSLFPQQQDMSDFNPFKIVVGGGKISLRMRSNFNNITVHYKNVDMLASGPPDALFDSNATQSQNGSSMEHARRFGSMGPEIYDEVLIGIPLASGINANNVSVKFGKLYNESWGEVWNNSAGNTTGDLPSDYSGFNLSFFNLGGMQCSTTNQNAACYVNLTYRMVWLTIPHFSGVDTTVSGTSGNFTATLNSTALAGNKALMNFTIIDTANATSWYNITFQNGAGFDASGAVVNISINGTQEPGDWLQIPTPSYVNVTSTSAATANSNTNQYINMSNVTVPSVAGNYTINVTTSNSLTVSLNYTVTTYGANLTVDSNAKTTTTSTNATYTLTLQNNGSETDTYNLTIDNPGAATAALNISGNITLASNAVQPLLLNVTNTTAGTFRVNVTARSNNDTSKFGYINTTTTVASYGVNLTLSGVMTQTTNAGTNANYTLILHNNGSTTDTYNLTIDNPGGATTAALNISGNITLASNSVQTLLLNVTSNAGGDFPVNVTARSNNDSTKFGYINTSTMVAVRGVSLTNISALAQTTNALTNVTYLLNLTNNGTGTDAYNLVVDNISNASIASINITSPKTLASGLTQIIALNVTNTTAGIFYVNVTATSTNDPTKIAYINTTTTVPSYGTNLSVDSSSRATTTSTNATYTLTLRNNGTATDTYNLTVDNRDSAEIAALNITTNITLASNAVQTLLLNVTNTTVGTFRVNVTARSNNDTSKFGYINTTTTVYAATYYPPAPTGLANTSGNFWVNHTWQAGSGNVTNSYNVSVNGTWTNSTSTYKNTTGMNPHGWANITVYAYNSSNNSLSLTSASQTTQVSNNAPVLASIGAKSVAVGNWLNFTINATDADSDTITYSTNATGGTLSSTTGNYSWAPAVGDVGTYTWQFISTDNYSDQDNETITVSVSAPTLVFSAISPANNSETSNSYANVTVTLNRTGTATLNWQGINESMDGSGTGFYKNKTGLLSGNYSFRIYASDSNSITNASTARNITVNRTTVNTSINNIINASTFLVNASLEIAAPGGNVTVTITNGTNASVNGAALTSISLDSLAQLNSTFVTNLGTSNKFIGENLTLGPDGAIFSPDIQIRFNYTHSQLTAAGIAESELAVKFYNTSAGAWESLTVSRNTTADYIIANASHFSTFALIGVPATTTTTTSSSSGGGGSGGGGLVTSEPYDNIAKAERYEKALIAGAPVTYSFKAPEHGIYEIAVTGKENENNIAIRVEALKGTSKLVTQNAPGTVYKNVNVWAGTKKITEAIIKFRVENSWLENNKFTGSDVKMVKWDGSQWVRLETSGSSKDGDYTYFEAKTDTFSSFAISVQADSAKPIASETPSKVTPSSTPARTTAPEPTKAPGFEMILAIVTIGILYLLERKR